MNNLPLYSDASYVDLGMSDEFEAASLDGQWTATGMVAGTVNPLTANPADSVYDAATRSKGLLVQIKPNDSGQAIRVDDTLADGEEIVTALSLATPGDNPGANNGFHVGVSVNNDDSAWHAGTDSPLYWDGANDTRLLWGVSGGSGQGLGIIPINKWTYWRLVRDGNDIYGFYSENLRSWSPFQAISNSGINNFWVFFDSLTISHDHAQIIEVGYVRHTAYSGIDPSWVT